MFVSLNLKSESQSSFRYIRNGVSKVVSLNLKSESQGSCSYLISLLGYFVNRFEMTAQLG